MFLYRFGVGWERWDQSFAVGVLKLFLIDFNTLRSSNIDFRKLVKHVILILLDGLEHHLNPRLLLDPILLINLSLLGPLLSNLGLPHCKLIIEFNFLTLTDLLPLFFNGVTMCKWEVTRWVEELLFLSLFNALSLVFYQCLVAIKEF